MDQPGDGGKDEIDRPLFSWVETDILVIHLDRPPSLSKLRDPETREALLTALEKASGVIFDLRGKDEMGFGRFVLGWLSPHLPARELRPAAERYLVHSGYRPQTGASSGGYFSAFQSTLPDVLPAAPGGKGKRVVFLVVEQTEIPPIAMALQEAGEAFLVAQGNAAKALGSGRRTVPLTEDFEVKIRTTELIGQSGLVQVRADAEVPAEADRGAKGPAFQKALTLLRDPRQSMKPAKQPDGVALPRGRGDRTSSMRRWPIPSANTACWPCSGSGT